MSLGGSDFEMPTDFSGVARLFPLPNLVLYPGVVQALHIFEPRYQAMTADALAGDQLICMSLINEADASEPIDDATPPICQTVCVSKIVASKELPDGRFNLLVVGVKRAIIIREIPSEKPYRMAEVKLIEDECDVTEVEIAELRANLIETCKTGDLFTQLTEHLDVKNVADANLPLGLLVDLISFLSQLNCENRQLILKLANVMARCEKLIALLDEQAEQTHGLGDEFPPKFSLN